MWNTAAHELAHLRHLNHGVNFQEFELEMQQAIRNRREDYAAKVLERLVKLQKQRESEAQLGNTEAAEAFAGLINKMLIENELNPSDIDYARGMDRDPVIEIRCDLNNYPMTKHSYDLAGKKSRIAWQEQLAGVVAHGHLCQFLIQLGTNNVTFVGTKSHATTAEYVYGNLVRAATSMSFDARIAYHTELRRKGRSSAEGRGFRESWLAAFVNRIDQKLREARAAAVREVSSDINVQQTGLMRLNQALVKTQNYLDDKFGRKRKYANALNGGRVTHHEGAAAGRAAADSLNIGRKGVEARRPIGQIGGGGQ